jgi:anaerobic magnesium-protoporphyrin IX monomethyl ester cyclase
MPDGMLQIGGKIGVRDKVVREQMIKQWSNGNKVYDMILISPKNTQLGRFTQFVPRSVPLGAGIIAGFLRNEGYGIALLDEETVDMNEDTLRPFLERCEKPRIVGISCMTSNIARGYRIAKVIRSIDPETKIVFGGIHATTLPEEVLDHECDYVVVGEGEYAFKDLVRQIKREKIEPQNLRGVAYREASGKTIYTSSPWRDWVDINELPMFPYDMLDVTKYDFGFILTSRGCPFDCIYCSQRAISKRVFRYMKTEKVIEELDYLVNGLKIPNITFFDDYFTPNRKRVLELCEAMREKGFHKTCSFGVQTRADSVDQELLGEMRAAGFNSIMFGTETASEEVMTNIYKEQTVADNATAIKEATKAGFNVETTYIYGLPGETFDARVEALRFSRKMGVSRARFNNITPYPGTTMYRIAKEEGGLVIENDWDNFSSAAAVTAGLKKKYSMPYTPPGMTERELTGTVFLANLLFYANFSKAKALLNPWQKGSGKWFEFPWKDLWNPLRVLDLSILATTVILRAIYYPLVEKGCRKFFFKGLRI